MRVFRTPFLFILIKAPTMSSRRATEAMTSLPVLDGDGDPVDVVGDSDRDTGVVPATGLYPPRHDPRQFVHPVLHAHVRTSNISLE